MTKIPIIICAAYCVGKYEVYNTPKIPRTIGSACSVQVVKTKKQKHSWTHMTAHTRIPLEFQCISEYINRILSRSLEEILHYVCCVVKDRFGRNEWQRFLLMFITLHA